MNKSVAEYLTLLGTQQVDRVTHFEGMVDSVCFDAYGCVQASLKPTVNQEGKPQEGYWFDIKRLRPGFEKGRRIMDAPLFLLTPVGEEIGAAEKPMQRG